MNEMARELQCSRAISYLKLAISARRLYSLTLVRAPYLRE